MNELADTIEESRVFLAWWIGDRDGDDEYQFRTNLKFALNALMKRAPEDEMYIVFCLMREIADRLQDEVTYNMMTRYVDALLEADLVNA